MKADNRKALYARAERAIRALYHNASPSYPCLPDQDADRFKSWFEDAAEQEIDYLGSGGAHGIDYAATLAHPANGGKLKSARARQQYIAHGMRDMQAERNDCGMLTGWKALELSPALGTAGKATRAKWGRICRAMNVHPADLQRNNALWEYITDYGKLYTFGCGGRTLAPADLWRDGGSGHRPKVDGTEWNHAAATRAIQVLESFNAHVKAWCASVPERWAEHEREREQEEKAESRRQRAERAKETRERHYWEARGVMTC